MGDNICYSKVIMIYMCFLILTLSVGLVSSNKHKDTCKSAQITRLEKNLKAEMLAMKQEILNEISKIAPKVRTIRTPNNYHFEHPPIDVSCKDFFTFDVKTCHDGHILLSKTAGETDVDTYEILLQGWNNIRKTSAIRDKRQGELKVYYNGQVVYCDETKSFWISWRGGHIEVGRGHVCGKDTFLQWQDPSPHPVNAIQFTSGFGANGTWTYPV